MLVLLHPPAPRHYDRQPGTDHLDPQSHELHSGKRAGRLRGQKDFSYKEFKWLMSTVCSQRADILLI